VKKDTEVSALDLTKKIVEGMMGNFIALIVCQSRILEGDATKLVIWFPNFFMPHLPIGSLREFTEIIGPKNTEITMSKRDGSCCIGIDFKPESEQDVAESISEIKAVTEEIFSVQSALVYLGDEDFAKFLKEACIGAAQRTLH